MHEHAHNLIKTLRVFQAQPYDNKYEQVEQILLEAVPGYTFAENKAKFNQISVLEFDYKIYFWRRRRNLAQDKRWEMQLWKYNILQPAEKRLEQVIHTGVFEGGKLIDRLDEFSVPFPAGSHADEESEAEEKGKGEPAEDAGKKKGGLMSAVVGGLVRGVKEAAGKVVGAARDIGSKVMGKGEDLTGSGEYHFLFAGRIGEDQTNYQFDWTQEEKQYNQGLLKALNDDEEMKKLENRKTATDRKKEIN
jgi:hypothetical protein